MLNSAFINRVSPLGRWRCPRYKLCLLAGLFGSNSLMLAEDARLAQDAQATRWRIVDRDCELHVLEHVRCLAAYGTTTSGSDRMRYRCGKGSRLLIEFAIPQTPIIDELFVEVAVQSQRPGIRLSLCVVLPRELDADTGFPKEIRIPGETSGENTGWQTLRMSKLPVLLEQQARIERARTNGPVDVREAFIRAVVLDLYTQPGTNQVYLADPRFSGNVTLGPARPADQVSPQSSAQTTQKTSSVDIAAGTLTVDGRPFFTLAIEERGEDWRYLKDLGFNTIRLKRPPSARDLARAEELDVWLVCPAPDIQNAEQLRGYYTRVLAWEVPTRASSVIRPPAMEQRPGVVPFVGDNLTGIRDAEIIWDAHDILGTEYHFADHLERMRDLRRCQRLESLLWARVATNWPRRLTRQIEALAGETITLNPSPTQIQHQALLGIMAGARGFIFTSDQRLDDDTASSRLRALAVRNINHQLETIGPILASGVLREDLPPSHFTDRGVVLESTVGTVALWGQFCPENQLVNAPTGMGQRRIQLPGGSPEQQVYVLGSPEFAPLPAHSIPGGVEVDMPEAEPWAILFMTADSRILKHLEEVHRREAPRWHSIRWAQCREYLRDTEDHVRLALSNRAWSAVSWKPYATMLEQARGSLHRARKAFESYEYAHMREQLHAATRKIETVRFQVWNANRGNLSSEIQSPLHFHFASSCRFSHLFANLPDRPAGVNMLDTGDCEDLTRMLRAGWKVQVDSQRSQVQAQLSSDRVFSGEYSLRLQVEDALSSCCPPCLQVISPPLMLPAGQAVLIRGMVYVEGTSPGPGNRVGVRDSWGGRALTHQIQTRDAWTPFCLLRCGDGVEPLTWTLTIQGPGRVHLDDCSVVLLSHTTRPLRSTP